MGATPSSGSHTGTPRKKQFELPFQEAAALMVDLSSFLLEFF
jgi:hypothetical protein